MPAHEPKNEQALLDQSGSNMNMLRSFILATSLLASSTPFALSTTDPTWLNKLNGYDPTLTDDTDLVSFAKEIQGATIVGLGETTHSTHEFFLMKHRLLKYLVTKQGYTIFAMEQNMARCSLINDYVLSDVGNPKEILGSDNYMYASYEVLNLIEWVRTYNQTAKQKIIFAGFDMQDDIYKEHTPSPDIINKLLARAKNTDLLTMNQALSEQLYKLEKLQLTIELDKSNNNTSAKLSDTSLLVTEEQAYQTALNKFEQQVATNRYYLLQSISEHDYDWLVQNINLLNQLSQLTIKIYNGTEQDMFNLRDAFMSKNITWLQTQYPGTKIVLWAHSGHIQGTPFTEDGGATFTTMGTNLKHALHTHYRAFTFLTYEGVYSAFGSKGFANYPLEIPPLNTLESHIDSYGYPMAFFNFTALTIPAYLRTTMHARDVPWAENSQQFIHYMSDSTMAFDGAFYFRDTTAATNFLFQ